MHKALPVSRNRFRFYETTCTLGVDFSYELDFRGRNHNDALPASAGPPLLLGEFVEVEITGVAPESFFRAPRAALQPGNELWVATPGGRVGIVPVQVLQRADDEVFVTGDLESGQSVITGGIQYATEGMRIRTQADPSL